MLEECKQLDQMICGECAERSVSGVHFWKPMKRFADVLTPNNAPDNLVDW